MNDKLSLMLSELADIETEIGSMIHILDRLDELYERDKLYETRCCEQVLRGWIVYVKDKVTVVVDKLDQYILENGIEFGAKEIDTRKK